MRLPRISPSNGFINFLPGAEWGVSDLWVRRSAHVRSWSAILFHGNLFALDGVADLFGPFGDVLADNDFLGDVRGFAYNRLFAGCVHFNRALLERSLRHPGSARCNGAAALDRDLLFAKRYRL